MFVEFDAMSRMERMLSFAFGRSARNQTWEFV